MLKNVIKRAIVLDKLAYDTGDPSGVMATEAIEMAKTKPLVIYKDFILKDVLFLEIDSSGFIPKLSMVVKDQNSFITLYFPTNDDRIKIRVDPNNDAVGSLRCDFKITKAEIMSDLGEKTVMIEGLLDVNEFYLQSSLSFVNKTSYDVYESFAKKAGLGFYTNVSSTNDRMTWLNPTAFGYVFLQEVIQHAWIGTESLPWAFCDWYYNLTFIDLQKAFSQERTRSKISINVNLMDTSSMTKNPENATGSNFILSNHPSYSTTNLFLESVEVSNTITETAIDIGYSTSLGWYDTIGNYKTDKVGTIIWKSITDLASEGSKPKKIEVKNKTNTDFYKRHKTNNFVGKLNRANVHENYYWAEGHNDWNIRNAQRISLKGKVKGCFLYPYRFEKILLLIVDSTNTNAGPINELSGDWVVSGMNYNWTTEDGGYTEIIFIKKDIGLGDAAKDITEEWNRISSL